MSSVYSIVESAVWLDLILFLSVVVWVGCEDVVVGVEWKCLMAKCDSSWRVSDGWSVWWVRPEEWVMDQQPKWFRPEEWVMNDQSEFMLMSDDIESWIVVWILMKFWIKKWKFTSRIPKIWSTRRATWRATWRVTRRVTWNDLSDPFTWGTWRVTWRVSAVTCERPDFVLEYSKDFDLKWVLRTCPSLYVHTKLFLFAYFEKLLGVLTIERKSRNLDVPTGFLPEEWPEEWVIRTKMHLVCPCMFIQKLFFVRLFLKNFWESWQLGGNPGIWTEDVCVRRIFS